MAPLGQPDRRQPSHEARREHSVTSTALDEDASVRVDRSNDHITRGVGHQSG